MSSDDRGAVNVEQAEAWDGEEGAHWVAHQQRYEAMSNAFTEPLLTAAALDQDDRVLDIGCGCGQTTRLAARRAVRGSVLGVDLSSAMLQRAREDAAAQQITNVTFEQGDAQAHAFPASGFDVAISRFGVMFFDDPVAAFGNIRSALTSSGRLAFLCWQDLARNAWILVPASAALEHVPFPDLGGSDAPGPFSFADPDRITDVLGAAGFGGVTTTAVEGSLRLGDDAVDAVEFLSGTGIARALFEDVDPDTTARALDAVRDALRPHEQPDGLSLSGSAWLVTARSA